ncbi:hypothetical protein Mal15_60790 [Stieleria maiorica]|uniref:DUF1501 domain-containing protein n=1 Tax=Stieleria maiorica TaxID=2795974 RepID=A0A5B9MQF0_9BACT|nr:DUF1501 domain-containing protein [Stieleria maiorica]QEG01996.1 hypothetical protein Mal15_60790 [Stieleria maiorica]
MSVLNPVNRRQWIRCGSAAGLSTWLGRLVAEAAESNHPTAPFRRCITLWMQGGPSQMETFDPKPGTETGGPLQAVATSVPGMRLCETLSDLASYADDLCLIRSVGSNQGEHDRASHLLHTGYERIDSFPRPALGSYVASTRPASDVPGFVTLGDLVYGPAFLGTEHGPFVVNDLGRTIQTIRSVQRRRDQLDLLTEWNRHSGSGRGTAQLRQRSEQIDSVRRLLKSSFSDALDVSAENASTRARYGDSDFGRNVLAARRMLESGVRYVEVQLPGWDTHVGNVPAVKRLCQQLQPAWIALIDDLKANGLWDDTLILWMGEFGRTPVINGQNGRDHYPRTIPVTLAGRDIGGRVIGSTGKDGQQHDEAPRSVADLMYTLMRLLGVDADQAYTTGFGSPTKATDGGEMIL